MFCILGEREEGNPIRDSLVVYSGGGVATIRQGAWKLIQGLGSGGFSQPRRVQPTPDGPKGQLYDLADDPGETKNLYLEKPDIVRRLTSELERIQGAAQTRS